MYGIGYTLNKSMMGFLLWGDKVPVISVLLLLFYFKLVYVVMLFALGTIWQSSLNDLERSMSNVCYIL